MRGAVLHGPGDVRVEHRDDPTISKPTDATTAANETRIRLNIAMLSFRSPHDIRGGVIYLDA